MNIAVQRLYSQRLAGPTCPTPDAVVAALGAVQAQEYALAKWALALRMEAARDAALEAAFAAGTILRTHVLRPTWHFVAPADIRWLLELTAPRVHQTSGHRYRQLELDEVLLQRSDALLVGALEGGKFLTRAELGAVLAEAGIDASDGGRLTYLVMHAELEGVLCSGPRRGKQHTYALLAERAPQARRLTRDEALAELTLRYFSGHGPATVADLTRWASLTVADVTAGLDLVGGALAHEAIDGQTYWFAAAQPSDPPVPPAGCLLPVYDEFTNGYKAFNAGLDPQYAQQLDTRRYTSAFVLGGEVIGMWRRTFSKKTVVIESAPFRPYSADEQVAFNAAAARFGDFLGLDVVLA